MKATATIKIEKQMLVDLFVMACEGGSNYWAKSVTPAAKSGDAYESMLKGFVLVDGTDGKSIKVTPKMIAKAVKVFPKESPVQFEDVLNDTCDATTGDVFLQLCCFGKVIYG